MIVSPKLSPTIAPYVLAFGFLCVPLGVFIAVRTRCPHCHRRFAESYVFARLVILLWAAKDRCPFCGEEV